MSHGDTPLQSDSAPNCWVDEGPSTQTPKNDSFAHLIRAREEQQKRIRDALEEQNRQLRVRLAFEEANQCGATSASSAAAVCRLSSRSPSKQPTVPVEEFITFVTEMKHLINYAQEADLVALHALQDRVDFQKRDLTQRIGELEAQMIAMRRREEFGYASGDNPFALMTHSSAGVHEDKPALEYVLHELENVRRTAEEVAQRARKIDETLERQQTSSCLFERDLNALETKMVDFEFLPTLFRQEAMALEERYVEFTHRVQEEMAQKQEQPPLSFEGNAGPIRLLQEQLQAVERAVVELGQRDTVAAKDHVTSDMNDLVCRLVNAKVQEIKETIESSLWEKLQELHKAASNTAGGDPTLSPGEGAPLGSNRMGDTTTSLLEDLAERVQHLETTLHAVTKRHSTEEFSVKEQLVESPTNVLEGAAVILERAIARSETSFIDASILDTRELVERVERIETQVNALEDRLIYFTTKLETRNTEHKTPTGQCVPTTDIGVQCSPIVESDGNHVVISTKSRPPQEGVNHHLQDELELAALGLYTGAVEHLGMPRNVDATTPPNGGQYVDDNISMALPPAYAATLCTRRRKPATREETRTISFGPFKAPHMTITPESLSKTIAAMHERKRHKEDAVKKVIAALRDVQKQFSKLSEREPPAQRNGTRRSGCERTTSSTQEDSDPLLETIVSQKEAIHFKEKQLMILRNKLWREIAQLEEDERELLA
ncbi:hypothetical protein TRSC58_03378 [Trypanosoma rangeli SC58]|uniref:Uncharacterized protein n=1 Tax=Trypanosoma rangeli SC58 TaxID=429131 RepID=A0A061J435_TRYRA|nr:hypothetical protein TRSC58_03378 [Trypanosoma rangeli SC58]